MTRETAVVIYVSVIFFFALFLLVGIVREERASRKRKKRWEIHEKGTIADSLDKPEELK